MALVQKTSTLQSFGQLLCSILLFLFVLVLAYLTARFVGGYQSNLQNKNTNIKVIEVFRLSNNKYIQIVQIGEQYLALAVCKDNVEVLTHLNEDELKVKETSLEPINFKNLLEKMKNEKQNHSNK